MRWCQYLRFLHVCSMFMKVRGHAWDSQCIAFQGFYLAGSSEGGCTEVDFFLRSVQTLSSLSRDNTLRYDRPIVEHIRSPFAYSLLLQAINLAFLTSPKLTHHKVQPVLWRQTCWKICACLHVLIKPSWKAFQLINIMHVACVDKFQYLKGKRWSIIIDLI